MKCSRKGCDRQHQAKGLCHKHYMNQWYIDHPEAKEAARVRMNKVPREISRSRQMKHYYGIDMSWYRQKLVEQGNVCAICKQPETATIRGNVLRLAVDHCHDTGKARALLCRDCNRAIGLLRHNPANATAAADYLTHHA